MRLKKKNFKPELLDLEEAPLGRNGFCCDKVDVVNEEKFGGVWKHQREIFGEYQLEKWNGGKPIYKSTFDSGKFGIWYQDDGKGRLTIGLHTNIGNTAALAYYETNDDKCPNDPAYEEWFYKKGSKGDIFQKVDNQGLTIRCKD